MMLPIDIQMQIDICAQMHQREIAEGFAKLREKLLPPPEPQTLEQLLFGSGAALMQQNLQASQNPMLHGWSNAANSGLGVLGGLGWPVSL